MNSCTRPFSLSCLDLASMNLRPVTPPVFAPPLFIGRRRPHHDLAHTDYLRHYQFALPISYSSNCSREKKIAVC
eukprot:m.396742 g.396742  ORF g.396742 m.396742 type:complete len:74 (+) comp28364_c0_seq1:8430-8651(+)